MSGKLILGMSISYLEFVAIVDAVCREIYCHCLRNEFFFRPRRKQMEPEQMCEMTFENNIVHKDMCPCVGEIVSIRKVVYITTTTRKNIYCNTVSLKILND